MNDEAERLTIINRLLACFPATASGQGDDVVDGYLIGLSDIPLDFIAHAAKRFLGGQVPGQHSAFPPSPAQLATEARGLWYQELDRHRRDRLALAPPEANDIPDDERERVRAGFEKLVADMAERARTEDAAAEQRTRQQLAKANKYFMPDMSDAAVMERLMGYSVGSPESEEMSA